MPTRFAVCLSSPVGAEEQISTVTGIVVDSQNRPVGGALVFVDQGTGSATTTNAIGTFRLEAVTPGTHLLNFRKVAFAPRGFRLELGGNDGARQDVGVIMLEDGPGIPNTTLIGRVLQGGNGIPIDGAVVELNGDVVAVSGDDGRFQVSLASSAWGSNQIQVGGFTYLNETTEIWITDPNETFDLSVTLHPEPIALPGVVAVVERPDRTVLVFDRRLQPFYERLEDGRGRFFTRFDIEQRSPVLMTDLLRGVPGIRISRLPSDPTFSFEVIFPRGCVPLIYVDGAALGRGIDIDGLMTPEQVEGMEVYTRGVQVPMQYRQTGAACGAIVMWTR